MDCEGKGNNGFHGGRVDVRVRTWGIRPLVQDKLNALGCKFPFQQIKFHADLVLAGLLQKDLDAQRSVDRFPDRESGLIRIATG